MAYMYILESADGTFYTGSTWDIKRRLSEHNEGVGVNFTSKRLPVGLAYSEEYDGIGKAFLREKQIQGWSHAKKKALIQGEIEVLKIQSKKTFKA